MSLFLSLFFFYVTTLLVAIIILRSIRRIRNKFYEDNLKDK